eukprot:ANDGO_07443.mRNA.1 hypothetical protein
MGSINGRLQDLIASLELREDERAKAVSRHTKIREEVLLRNAVLPCKLAFLTGSYERRTCIRPLHDIDLFAVVDTDRFNLKRVTARELLELMSRVIRDAYPTSRIRIQWHSVNIKFADGVAFDILPAFAKEARTKDGEIAEYYVIPEVIDENHPGKFIATNPRLFSNWSSQVHGACSGILSPLFKLMKLWRRSISRRYKAANRIFPLYSHLLEATVYHSVDPEALVNLQIPTGQSSLGTRLRLLFSNVLSFLQRKQKCLDICSLTFAGGPTFRPFDEHLTDSTRAEVIMELKNVLHVLDSWLLKEAKKTTPTDETWNAYCALFGIQSN